jgi:hypothetical protein
MPKPSDESYSKQETERRREAALKRMLSTPHKPHKSLGKKRTAKQRKDQTVRPTRRGSRPKPDF